MSDEQEPDETPWKVSEYRFEPPLWFDLLFKPSAVWPPLTLAALVLLIHWLA
ncbi:hypothetical protein [Sphingomonas parva]|uniref:hypothetical protein n=1 Tax=Sphingomonas parva TaxID=2555898 RepID=UPI0014313583|nr:hypothetical protein [Sphingomonas parva]